MTACVRSQLGKKQTCKVDHLFLFPQNCSYKDFFTFPETDVNANVDNGLIGTEPYY